MNVCYEAPDLLVGFFFWFPFYHPGNTPVVDPGVISTVYLLLCLTRSNLHCPGGDVLNVDELLGRAEILFHPLLQTMWILLWILFSCITVSIWHKIRGRFKGALNNTFLAQTQVLVPPGKSWSRNCSD